MRERIRSAWPEATHIAIDSESGRLNRLRGHNAVGVDWRSDAAVTRFMAQRARDLGFAGRGHTFEVDRRITDAQGYTHIRLQHLWRGVPVFGSFVILHADASGVLRIVNGGFVPEINRDIQPVVSADQAIDIAQSKTGADIYRWELPEQEALLKEIHNDPARSWRPAPRLVIAPVDLNYRGDDYRLAWDVTIRVQAPVMAGWRHFVDAKTGEVIARWDDEPKGTGTGIYNGTVSFVTTLNGSYYEMEDPGRRIHTHNGDGGNSLGNIMKDPDDIWDGQSGPPPKQVAAQDDAVDGHWGAARMYDYWESAFGRQGLESPGDIDMVVNVNASGTNWTGSHVNLSAGGVQGHNEYTSLDILGHEFGHALVEFTSGLPTGGTEAGVLNGGYSDINGISVDFAFGPSPNWKLLDEQTSDPGFVRRLDNPNASQDPDTYGGSYWDLDHQGGVMIGHHFYLLCEGGAGANDNGNAYNITAIGMEDAAAIWYKANNDMHISPTSTIAEARAATALAAELLFGYGSTQHVQTFNAWYAVGVSDVPYAVADEAEPAVVSGRVTRPWGTGVGNVILSITGQPPRVTDANGNYVVVLEAGWTGTITPSKQGWTFDPASRSYTSILGVKDTTYTDQDYEGTPPPPPPCAKCPDPHEETPGIGNDTPTLTRLVAIEPNPFTVSSAVRFELAEPADARITIYNVKGQVVRRQHLGLQGPGFGTWAWNGRDHSGRMVASGVYFVVFDAAGIIDRRKAVFLRP